MAICQACARSCSSLASPTSASNYTLTTSGHAGSPGEKSIPLGQSPPYKCGGDVRRTWDADPKGIGLSGDVPHLECGPQWFEGRCAPHLGCGCQRNRFEEGCAPHLGCSSRVWRPSEQPPKDWL